MPSHLFHTSDLHLTWGVTCHDAVPWMTGDWHTRVPAEAIVRSLAARLERGDRNWHLVITGDVTDTGSREELALARQVLAPIWDPRLLTVVPGNHDIASDAIAAWVKHFTAMSVPGSFEARARSFRRTFGELMQSSAGFEQFRWPFVKVLRNLGYVIVGLDSVADNRVAPEGLVGDAQLDALDEILEMLNRDRRYRDLAVFVALHHPAMHCDAAPGVPDGLQDAERFREIVAGRVTGVLHGHHHGSVVAWNGTDRQLPMLQAPAPSFATTEIPTTADAVEMLHYRVRGGDLRDRNDVEIHDVPLSSAFRARQAEFRERYAQLFRPAVPCDCGGPIVPEFDFCPWCSSEVGFGERGGTVCTACDRPVLGGYAHCPWCGEAFEDDAGRYDSGRMTARCAGCESDVEPYHAYCPACGETLPPPDDSHPETCTTCDWPVDTDVYLYCPWCANGN